MVPAWFLSVANELMDSSDTAEMVPHYGSWPRYTLDSAGPLPCLERFARSGTRCGVQLLRCAWNGQCLYLHGSSDLVHDPRIAALSIGGHHATAISINLGIVRRMAHVYNLHLVSIRRPDPSEKVLQ